MVRFGVPGQNTDTLAYADGRLSTVPVVQAPRRPTINDKKFPIWCEWRVNKDADPSELEGEFWKLVKFESNGDANWMKFDSGTAGALDDLRDQANVNVTPSVTGLIDIDGVAVANGANPSSIPLETVANTITHTLDAQIQVAATSVGAPGSKNISGICCFDSTMFSVDIDGFVQLIGGGIAVDTVTGDDAVAVGPDGAGNINYTGETVANATNAKPVFFDGNSITNTQNLEVQVASAVAASPIDKLDCGLASFDTVSFDVDANGFVQLKGGSGIAVDQIDVDFSTPPGTDPVGANGSGEIAIIGDTVANATNAKPVASHSRALNSLTVEVQVGVARTGVPGDKLDAGIVSFDDTSFDVDSDGFVTFTGSSGGGFTWNDVVGTSDTFVNANGYVTNNAGLVTMTLPATCAFGDTFRIAGLGAGGWLVAQNASQVIHTGNMDTTVGVGGSLASTNRYDSLEFLCVVTDTEFLVLSQIGNITVT